MHQSIRIVTQTSLYIERKHKKKKHLLNVNFILHLYENGLYAQFLTVIVKLN